MTLENPIPPAPRPGSINASAIVRTDFAQVRRGGYDPRQVTEHLNRVANYIADLERRISDLETDLQERSPARPIDEAARNDVYQSVASHVAELVRSFDQEMERARANAYNEAEALLADARANAERLEREAEQRRAEVDRTADDVARALDARRAALIEDVRRIHDALQRSASAAAAILQHGNGEVVIVDEAPRTPG